jgi:hypothetical protein
MSSKNQVIWTAVLMSTVIFILLLVLNQEKLVNYYLQIAQPVEIERLGSLPSLNNKDLNENDLVKVLKTVSSKQYVNNEDAAAMLEIYERNIKLFSEISSQNTAEAEAYLMLILKHEDLRNEAEQITYKEAIRILSQRLEFSESNSGTNKAGEFIAVFMNAYLQDDVSRFDKIQTEDFKDKKYIENQGATKRIVLRSYEQIANGIVSGQIKASSEQKLKAIDFLKDLKIYNEELADDEKILDSNGRLLDSDTVNKNQKPNMDNVVIGLGNSNMKNEQKGVEASKQMATLLIPAYESFRNAINDNLKRR